MCGWLELRDRRAPRARSARGSCGSLGELRRQDLDRDGAIEARVARLVDLAHAAGAGGGRISYGPRRVPGDSNRTDYMGRDHGAVPLPGGRGLAAARRFPVTARGTVI